MKFVSLIVRSVLVGAMVLSLHVPKAWSQVTETGNSATFDDETSNQPPFISDARLTDSALTNDVLEVGFDASDPDGDPLTATCQWMKNGVPIDGETGLTLDLSQGGYGDRGDSISVIVSVSDPYGGVATAPEVAVTVGDSWPTISRVSIDKTKPRTTELLTARPVVSDPDGDALVTTYQWKKNGANIDGATGPTLDLSGAGNGDKGDNISVVATVSDGEGTSEPVESGAVTVLNTPPSLWSGPVVSTWAGRSVMGRAQASDPDGDVLQFSAPTPAATNGTLLGVDPRDSLFLFRPGTTVGPASFYVSVSDGQSCATIKVPLMVEAAPAPGTRIYTALGDSTALAKGASTFSKGYSARMNAALQNAEGPGANHQWQLSVRGIIGFSAPDMLREVGGESMLSLAVEDNPEVITVWLGLNDVQRIALYKPALETEDEFTNSYNTLISTLATHTQAKVVVCDVPDIARFPFGTLQTPDDRSALSQMSAALQRHIDAAVQGIRPGFSRVVLLGDPGTLSNFCGHDGFHPSDKGYALVAAKMFQALARGTGMAFAPTVVAVTPQDASDSIGNKRSFGISIHDSNGGTSLSQIELQLRSSGTSGGTGAYLLYSPQNGFLLLRSGRTWLGPIHTGKNAGAQEVLDNGAVRIAGRDVSVQLSSDGATLTLSLPVTIGSKLVGTNAVFVRVKDNSGRTDPQSLRTDAGFVRAGNYSVTSGG